ncbi:MAG: carbohydrate ABC transporter permease, partial [Clostridia bacterium]|nr:carbohydrate ABC transporter permease [Clostridia bacterium]
MRNKKAYRRYTRSLWGNIFYFTFLIVFGAFAILPLVYTVITSFKPLDELLIFPPRFYVVRPTLENYKVLPTLLSNLKIPLSRYIFNSLFVSVVSTIAHIFVASGAAYTISKSKIKYKNLVFSVVQFALLFNAYTLAIPRYLIYSNLRMIDTYWVYILPYIPSALGVFLMKQFM